jgi:hypothetical protein
MEREMRYIHEETILRVFLNRNLDKEKKGKEERHPVLALDRVMIAVLGRLTEPAQASAKGFAPEEAAPPPPHPSRHR